MSSRIVIAGAGGQLGSSLVARVAGQGREVLALTSSQWDITDPAAAESIVKSGDVVINCAAYTNVDGAESNESAAHAINVVGPELDRARVRTRGRPADPRVHRLRVLRRRRAAPVRTQR